jgi:5-hydroxyisourate hydrolase
MTSLSTHVLDAVTGTPAAALAVELLSDAAGEWRPVASGRTDADGRIPSLGAGELGAGRHRLVFATGDWFSGQGVPAFYPEVVVTFEIDEERHYHVPLLLSPYAYSTYRGS